MAMMRRTWRDRWPMAVTDEGAVARQLVPERLERAYGSVTAYQRDAAMLAKDGWQGSTVDDRRVRRGEFRAAALSWLRGRRHAGPDIVVAYRRLH